MIHKKIQSLQKIGYKISAGILSVFSLVGLHGTVSASDQYDFTNIDQTFIDKYNAYKLYLEAQNKKRSEAIKKTNSADSLEDAAIKVIENVIKENRPYQRRYTENVKQDQQIWQPVKAKNINLQAKIPAGFKKTWDTLNRNSGELIFEKEAAKIIFKAYKNQCQGSPALVQSCFDDLVLPRWNLLKGTIKVSSEEAPRTIQWRYSNIGQNIKQAKNSGKLVSFKTAENQQILSFLFLEPNQGFLWELRFELPLNNELANASNYIKIINSLFKKEVKKAYKKRYENNESTRKHRYTSRRARISNDFDSERVELEKQITKNLHLELGLPKGSDIRKDDLEYAKGDFIAENGSFRYELLVLDKKCEFQSFNLIRRCIEEEAEKQHLTNSDQYKDFYTIYDKNQYLQLKKSDRQKSNIGRVIKLKNKKTGTIEFRMFFQEATSQKVWKLSLRDSSQGILDKESNISKITASLKFR